MLEQVELVAAHTSKVEELEAAAAALRQKSLPWEVDDRDEAPLRKLLSNIFAKSIAIFQIASSEKMKT